MLILFVHDIFNNKILPKLTHIIYIFNFTIREMLSITNQI